MSSRRNARVLPHAQEVHLIMRFFSALRGWRRSPRLLLLLCVVVGGAAALAAQAVAGHRGHGSYAQANLISDIPGGARITDPNLVNPWGIAAGDTTPLWIADNRKDCSTLSNGGGHRSIPTGV